MPVSSLLLAIAAPAQAEPVLQCPRFIVDTKIRMFRLADVILGDGPLFEKPKDDLSKRTGLSLLADNISGYDGDLDLGHIKQEIAAGHKFVLLCKYVGTINVVPLYVPPTAAICYEMGYCD